MVCIFHGHSQNRKVMPFGKDADFFRIIICDYKVPFSFRHLLKKELVINLVMHIKPLPSPLDPCSRGRVNKKESFIFFLVFFYSFKSITVSELNSIF